MFFSRASFRNLKHKAKKGILLRIGMTESQPEEPDFKHLLLALNGVKEKLREMYKASRAVVASAKQFNSNLEKFCGIGLRSEEVFKKEVEFVSTLEERVCTALRRMVNNDMSAQDELIVQYKTAKLKFDYLHFKTVKNMRKNGLHVTVKEANAVMKAHADLPGLQEAYLVAKREVRLQRSVILTQLKTEVESKLEELRAVSGAQHHQLYCRYFKERLNNTMKICSEEATTETVNALVRDDTFSYHRSKPPAMLHISGSGAMTGLDRMEKLQATKEQDHLVLTNA